MMRTILAAVDGSEAGRKAAEFAANMARTQGARLRLLHVIEPLPDELLAGVGCQHHDFSREQLIGGQLLVEQLSRDLQLGNGDAIIQKGHAAEIICMEGDEQRADMIVLGAHGSGNRSRLMLGSVGNRVVNLAGRTVTIVR